MSSSAESSLTLMSAQLHEGAVHHWKSTTFCKRGEGGCAETAALRVGGEQCAFIMSL